MTWMIKADGRQKGVEAGMMSTEKTPTLVVDGTEKGFAYWLAKEFLSETTRRELSKCSVLLVPHEGWHAHQGPVFADGTQQLLEHLKAKLPANVLADVCIEEKDYHEVALYSDALHIGALLVTQLAFPTVVGVLVWWITTKATKPGVGVSVTISVERDEDGRKRTASINYQGPAEQLQAHLSRALRDITGQQESGVDPDYPAEPKE